jgi:hypothetical protein
MATIADMNITFKTPEAGNSRRTHICIYVDAGELQGFKFITIDEAKMVLTTLQNLIWRAEAKQPETEE